MNVENEMSKRVAVIDTGSNTIRLAVFDCNVVSDLKGAFANPQHEQEKSVVSDFPLGGATMVSDFSFREVIDVKNTAGLSNYVRDGIFGDDGIDKATRVLKEHLICAENLGCDEVYVFATAVLRNAKNSFQAVQKLEENLNLKIELLSGDEEAQLGLKGAKYHSKMNGGVLIDLGGGSCEITKFDTMNLKTASLKMGCVSAYSQFVSGIIPTSKECEKIEKSISKKIEEKNLKLKKEENVWGIGGSARAVAKFTREMKNLEKTPKHIRRSDISDLLEFLKCDRDAFSHVAVRSVPDRIHSLVPGCIILGSILNKTDARQIDICKRGLREGFLLSKLENC